MTHGNRAAHKTAPFEILVHFSVKLRARNLRQVQRFHQTTSYVLHCLTLSTTREISIAAIQSRGWIGSGDSVSADRIKSSAVNSLAKFKKLTKIWGALGFDVYERFPVLEHV